MARCNCGSMWWRFEPEQNILATDENGDDARFGTLGEKLKAFCPECKKKYWYDPDTRVIANRGSKCVA